MPAFNIHTEMKSSGFKIVMTLFVLLHAASCQVFPSDSAGGISCFQCHSVNNSDPTCHDPFDSALLPIKTSICSEGRRDHRGKFPGRYCFKIKGRRASDGVEIVVRRCSVDTLVDNTLKSHYGHFKIVSGNTTEQFFGTVSMCRFDGCNAASALSSTIWLTLGAALSLLLRATGCGF
ncbi:hypothetical protein BOX15_Mlig004212g1 [Macrostomum lignano]|uniref:Protein sleepless n=2 Tax=Macrostomum lignano TaxID=282301 RepID=A0A1I8GI83_9PLAT|nr:hypothetical protein BOX15_Mlig004212g1 [Macrostomum lignano]